MNHTELDIFRSKLATLVERVGAEGSRLRKEALSGLGGEADDGRSDVPADPADLGNARNEEDVTRALLENEEHLLAECQAALERIAQGSFGVCAKCAKPIAHQRLEAIPYARNCAPCARAAEREAGA